MTLAENLGKRVTLMIVKQVEFGVYLGNSQEKVLLPKREVPKGVEPGDPVDVFLYKDSSDRLIATTREPKIKLGELKALHVADAGKIGAFLEWGLPKDLLLPFKEQTMKVKKGDEVLVSLYIDKSNRLCATMKIYELLRQDPPYQKDDHVDGIIYDTSVRCGGRLLFCPDPQAGGVRRSESRGQGTCKGFTCQGRREDGSCREGKSICADGGRRSDAS